MRKPDVSFELFPPRSAAGLHTLEQTINRLRDFDPLYYSITYGAGGSGQEKSKALVHRLSQAPDLTSDVEVAAHITLAGAAKEEIGETVANWKALGVRRLVALRGDAPEPDQPFTPHPEGFADSIELVAFLAKQGDFDIAVAAYPEGHPDSRSEAADIEYLKRKQDAGASRAITQFFFNAESFLRFRDRAVAAGVSIPLIPGILPIQDIGQTVRFAERCGAQVPAQVREAFDGLDGNRETAAAVSVSLCVDLCRTLVRGGVDALHFYTLNRSQLTEAVCRLLDLRPLTQPKTEEAA